MLPPRPALSRESLAAWTAACTQARSSAEGTDGLQNSSAISTAELLKLIIPLFFHAAVFSSTHSHHNNSLLPPLLILYTQPTKAHYNLPHPH